MVRLRIVSLFLGVVLLVVALRWGVAQYLPMTCPLRRCTGIPCASCGLTRAAVALCHGQLAAASAQNLAAIPLAVVFLAWSFLLAWEAVTQRSTIRPLLKRYSGVLTWFAVGLMLTAWSLNLHRHFNLLGRLRDASQSHPLSPPHAQGGILFDLPRKPPPDGIWIAGVVRTPSSPFRLDPDGFGLVPAGPGSTATKVHGVLNSVTGIGSWASADGTTSFFAIGKQLN